MKKWEKAKRRGKAGEKLQERVVQPRPLPALAWPNAGGIPTLIYFLVRFETIFIPPV